MGMPAVTQAFARELRLVWGPARHTNANHMTAVAVRMCARGDLNLRIPCGAKSTTTIRLAHDAEWATMCIHLALATTGHVKMQNCAYHCEDALVCVCVRARGCVSAKYIRLNACFVLQGPNTQPYGQECLISQLRDRRGGKGWRAASRCSAPPPHRRMAKGNVPANVSGGVMVAVMRASYVRNTVPQYMKGSCRATGMIQTHPPVKRA